MRTSCPRVPAVVWVPTPIAGPGDKNEATGSPALIPLPLLSLEGPDERWTEAGPSVCSAPSVLGTQQVLWEDWQLW